MLPDGLLILDVTREGDPNCPADFSRALQEVIVKYLSNSLEEIEQLWLTVNLSETRQDYTSGQIYTTSFTIIERELARLEAALVQQGMTLQGLQTIMLVDNEAQGRNSLIVGLAVQVYKHTHVDPMVVGVQETGLTAWRVVDVIPEPGEVDWRDPQTAVFSWLPEFTWNTFDHLALSVIAQVQQVKSAGQRSLVSPDLDVACAELEGLCSCAQEMLIQLLTAAQVLPIHAVVSQLVPQLPTGMDELALWYLERVARRAFARACYLAMATKEAARDEARGACKNWALRRLDGKNVLDLPADLAQLIECVLDQVWHQAFRKEMRRQKGNSPHTSA